MTRPADPREYCAICRGWREDQVLTPTEVVLAGELMVLRLCPWCRDRQREVRDERG